MIHDLLMSEGYKVNGHAPSENHPFGQGDMDIYAVHTDARCQWA
jgi:hypothetical protein